MLHLEADLKQIFSAKELSMSILHKNNMLQEKIDVIFDLKSDVILEHSGYRGSEADVPSITLQTKDAKSITHDSIFIIEDQQYGVIELSHQNGGTTKVYLDKKQ